MTVVMFVIRRFMPLQVQQRIYTYNASSIVVSLVYSAAYGGIYQHRIFSFLFFFVELFTHGDPLFYRMSQLLFSPKQPPCLHRHIALLGTQSRKCSPFTSGGHTKTRPITPEHARLFLDVPGQNVFICCLTLS